MSIPKKATTAAGGVTVGGAIATVILALWWPDANAAVAVALTTLANAGIAAIGAYLPRMEHR